MAFSHNGKYIAACGMDDDHTIAIFDWRNNKCVASGKGPKSEVWSMSFNSEDN